MHERAKSLSHIGGRPLASLSAGLLARKGQATPAMRPQVAGTIGGMPDDLGWNDMGHEPVARQLPPVDPLPPVLVEREELVERIAEPVPPPVADVPGAQPATRAPRIARPAIGPKPPRRAAFTLRLDPERHLKLRLAAVLQRRSAQQLVTEALDQFLLTMPAVAEVAERLPGDDPAKR